MGSGTSRKPMEILLVEDSASDVRLMVEAFKEGTVPHNLSVVLDGEEALSFLRREGRHASAPRPDLILLDLNLPKKSGAEVLGEIKADGNLKRIPVVVLTTSSADEDRLKTYDLHGNCYITKPIGLDEFIRTVQAIEEFWLKVVSLPPGEEVS